MDFYDHLADRYDLIFPHHTSKERFIENQIKEGGKILDVGCATGSMAIALASHGHSVVAIDLNNKMIKIARKKAKKHEVEASFQVMDMLKISDNFKNGSFDLIYSIGNTLPHLANFELIQNFILQTYNLLKPSGKILIQMVNFDKMIDTMIKQLPPIEKDGITFFREYEYSKDHIIFKAILQDTINQKRSNISTKLLPVSTSKIRTLMKEAGFNDIQLLGDFSGALYNYESPATIIVGIK